MGIVVALRDFFTAWSDQKESYKDLSYLCAADPIITMAYKVYALEIAMNRLANSISMASFETYEEKKLVKRDNWWILNMQPNVNQNKTSFWHSVLRQMVYHPDGALIVQSDEGDLIVAEDYEMTRLAFKESYYTNILLPGVGDLRVGRKESEVMHFTFHNGRVKSIVDDVYADYGKLIGGSIKNYNRGNAMKFIVKIGAMFDQFKQKVKEDGSSEYDFIIDDIMKNRMKGLLSDTDSATPLEDGLDIKEIETSANTKSGAVTTRDITATFEDILNIVADAFHIPRGLMKGDIASVEAMTDNYLNLCVNPLAEEIESEINRKMYGKEQVLAGSRVRIDTSTVLTRDPVKFANAAEALFRIGGYSTNDIRRKMGEEPIAESWADEYYVTKNYERVNNETTTEEQN